MEKIYLKPIEYVDFDLQELGKYDAGLNLSYNMIANGADESWIEAMIKMVHTDDNLPLCHGLRAGIEAGKNELEEKEESRRENPFIIRSQLQKTENHKEPDVDVAKLLEEAMRASGRNFGIKLNNFNRHKIVQDISKYLENVQDNEWYQSLAEALNMSIEHPDKLKRIEELDIILTSRQLENENEMENER